MLPLRRGFVAAILASCLNVAAAQPQQEESSFDAWMYMLVVHLLAVIGLLQLARMVAGLCGRSRAVERRSLSRQTGSSDQVAASPAPASPCGCEGSRKEASGRNRGQYQ